MCGRSESQIKGPENIEHSQYQEDIGDNIDGTGFFDHS
jgi:hypothetical protein